MAFRDIKKQARSDLHSGLRVKMNCYPLGDSSATPIVVYARVHSEDSNVGDLPGTSFNYAETRETTPRLVFLESEHVATRQNVYVVSDTEAYEADLNDPLDLITRTTHCTRLPQEDIASYSPPPPD